MNRPLAFVFLISCLLLIAACSSRLPPMIEENTSVPAATPTQPAAVSPEPTATYSPEPSQGTTLGQLMSECKLVDSRDLAKLFSTAEKLGPMHTEGEVNRTIFSTEAISASETSCIFYVYYPPGQQHQQMLQVTYWLDVPDQATPRAWAQVWADARSRAAQAASGVGDEGFYDNGRLTFKQGDVYVTIEIIGTNLSTDASAGASQQMQMEKQIALDMQGRLAVSQ